jgi:hypothetical protein
MEFATRRTLTKRRLILAAGILAALVVAYLAGKAAWRNWRVGQELARIRAAGEPVTAADLAAMHRVPAGRPDATPAWQAAVQASQQLRQYPDELPLFRKNGEMASPEESWSEPAVAEKFVRQHAALYAQIDAALATPGDCAYLDDFSAGYYTLLDQVQQMRTIFRLLVLRAYLAAQADDADGAARNLVGALKAVDTLRREPILVSQLVRMVLNQGSVEALEYLLPEVAWNDEHLAAIQKQLLAIEYLEGLELAVLGERVQGIIAFNDPAKGGAGNVPAAVYQFWVRDDPLNHLRLMRELVEDVRGGWPVLLERTAKFEAVRRDQTAVRSPWRSAAWERPSSIAGPFRGMVERGARETARLQAAATGVAALRFRKAERRWPRSLQELVPKWLPEAPIDPFTGKPLAYRVDEESVIIYSVGVDGKDNGGVETPEVKDGVSSRNGQPDVVFRARAARGDKPGESEP